MHNVFQKSRSYLPGVDTASNRNEYQESFLGGKVGRCVRLTTLPNSNADCLEILGAATSWNPKGLPKACSRIALAFRSHFAILGARRVTWTTFRNGDPQVLGVTIQNVVTMPTLRPGFVQPCLKTRGIVTTRKIHRELSWAKTWHAVRVQLRGLRVSHYRNRISYVISFPAGDY